MARPKGSKNKELKQFCINGHDTFICGRTNGGRGTCRICIRKSNAKMKQNIRDGIVVLKSKKQFCLRNHDTFVVGRDVYGMCLECKRLAANREARKYSLRTKYDISLEEYEKFFQDQNELCLGCYQHQSEFEDTFVVDHDHKTGKIRGLLCRFCNLVIGQSKDRPEVLRCLADYIERNK